MDGQDYSVTGRLWSLGHSNLDFETFVRRLMEQDIQVVADVRSQPRSKFSPHFDRAYLEKNLPEYGIKYVFLGKELGGRPLGSKFYDEDGHALYSEMAESEIFQEGLRRLKEGVSKYRVAMVCSEEDPRTCHRHLLISRVLLKDGFQIDHIRAKGNVVSAAAIEEADASHQMALFPGEQRSAWRSLQSVSHKRAPDNFSAF